MTVLYLYETGAKARVAALRYYVENKENVLKVSATSRRKKIWMKDGGVAVFSDIPTHRVMSSAYNEIIFK